MRRLDYLFDGTSGAQVKRVVEVKVCGITSLGDAQMCVEVGVDALGLNFWPGTPRKVDAAVATSIVQAFPEVEMVGVFVDADLDEIRTLQREVGFDWIQLHGSEAPETVAALGPHCYKALGVAEAEDVARARRYPGTRILLDARVPGAMPGGTGVVFDWELAVTLAGERELTLAGGLNPANVAEAIAKVGPHRVDVASGVESRPGVKDRSLVEAFVAGVPVEESI